MSEGWRYNDGPYQYIVICRRDRNPETGEAGDYELATRQVFVSWNEALDYSKTIHWSRDPEVVKGRWHSLRLPKK